MKAIHYYIGMAGMAALLLASCVKDELHDTPHPNHGKITLTTDWTERTEGIARPESYIVCIGDYRNSHTEERNLLDFLFEPDTYRACVYNEADHISVNGTVAALAGETGKSGDYVHNAPEWFFSCAMDMAVLPDKEHEFTAEMRQQVRQLTLVLEITGGSADRIASIEGVLSGIAGTLDVDDGTHGTPSNIRLSFAKDTDGKYKCTVRLLGIAGTEQTLTAEIRYKDGTPSPVTLTSDLTDDLSGFNDEKKTPLTLGGEVVETPDAAGFTATINDWHPIKGGSVVAD